MSSRETAAGPAPAEVLAREELSDHLARLRLAVPDGFVSTQVPDEWVALTVPGQYQTRYYTVRSCSDDELVVDVVLHDSGLVTEWVRTDCVGDTVGVSRPKGSFSPPDDAAWLVLLGDLTALPAIARIGEWAALAGLPVTAYAESADGALPGYLPDSLAESTTWLDPPSVTESRLAATVRELTWPEGPGYFWMAGESAQMREIRRYLKRDLGWGARRFDVMGYWSGSRGRRARAVDPGPIYRRGKEQGLSEEQIWAEYDAAREAQEGVDER